MFLKTKHFGEIDVPEEKCIEFAAGLPGFEQMHRFAIFDSSEENSPFKWLQSLDNPEIAFAVANPFLIVKDYDFELSEDDVQRLSIENAEDVAVYSVIVVPQQLERMSMNLKAPIIINIRNKRGVQVILDTDKYTVRHYILEELRRQEAGAGACTDEKKGSGHRNK